MTRSLRAKNEIRVEDDQAKSHPVHVPEGMMKEIVRPLFEVRVIVVGTRPKETKTIQLETIDRAEKHGSAPVVPLSPRAIWSCSLGSG